jgi:hypothetical protein
MLEGLDGRMKLILAALALVLLWFLYGAISAFISANPNIGWALAVIIPILIYLYFRKTPRMRFLDHRTALVLFLTKTKTGRNYMDKFSVTRIDGIPQIDTGYCEIHTRDDGLGVLKGTIFQNKFSALYCNVVLDLTNRAVSDDNTNCRHHFFSLFDLKDFERELDRFNPMSDQLDKLGGKVIRQNLERKIEEEGL